MVDMESVGRWRDALMFGLTEPRGPWEAGNNLGTAIWLCSGEGGSGSVGMEKWKVAIKTAEQGAGEKASA